MSAERLEAEIRALRTATDVRLSAIETDMARLVKLLEADRKRRRWVTWSVRALTLLVAIGGWLR